MEPCRWKATLEYDGSAFVGWQVQPEGRSIQVAVEAALSTVAGHPVVVTASGRTDAGVHALGQVISFDLQVERSPARVRDGMNALLPTDVACVAAEVAPPGFDARRWVLRKRYRYTWLQRAARSVRLAGTACHHRGTLDVEAMAAAGRLLSGQHDFSSFRAVGCGAAHAVRFVEDVRVWREGELVLLEVTGNGFLRHMVRIIAGALADVGRGRRTAAWMGELLAARDRQRGAATAPAHGLTLVEVVYGDGPSPWREDDG